MLISTKYSFNKSSILVCKNCLKLYFYWPEISRYNWYNNNMFNNKHMINIIIIEIKPTGMKHNSHARTITIYIVAQIIGKLFLVFVQLYFYVFCLTRIYIHSCLNTSLYSPLVLLNFNHELIFMSKTYIFIIYLLDKPWEFTTNWEW